jgi:hypothetical protein
MKSNKLHWSLLLGLALFSGLARADSASLLTQAQLADPARFQFALTNKAEIRATPDNKAFSVWWQPATGIPTGVIVSLHGHASYAIDGMYLWQPYAQARGYALLALQWWFGGGEAMNDYYLPGEMYPIIAALLAEKGVQPGTVLFEGYSRGSANSYAMTALDTASGNRYFGTTLSISGGAAVDFPPNAQVIAGDFGALPFTGVQWMIYCGQKDPNPNQGGCPSMTAASNWVTQYGANVKLLIEDPNGDHGGFMTNSANVNLALDQFSPAVNRTLYLVSGWNLLGNTVNSALSVASSFGDTAKVSAVWKWVPATTRWAFYSPSLSSQELRDYASAQGFDVLSIINPGEGFWVQAKTSTTVQLANAAAVTAATVQSGINTGWNLVATAGPGKAADFDAATLWAWDPIKGVWYFYSRSLDASGELAATIQSKAYLDFSLTGKSLLQGVGFWVNKSSTASSTLRPPGKVTVSNHASQTLGTQTFGSSTKLAVSWEAPTTAVDHYEVTANEVVQNTKVSLSSTSTSALLSGLKAATTYTVAVKSCADAACQQSATGTAVDATTSGEFWQLQGSGNTTAGLTRIVSDGNVRISATRIGSDAASSTTNRIQLYYGPNAQTSSRQALSTAIAGTDTSAAVPASYLSFTSSAATTGLISPATAATAVKQIATGQGVPLSASMGGKIRLFFEAQASDGKTRIYSLDSQDGYVGQDFNSGVPKTCSTSADYSSGGGCVPTVQVGVNGDSVNPSNKLSNVRQFKLGFPTLTDWRWDGAPGTFMVLTTDLVTGCSSYNMNHAYAVWDGARWVVQYGSDGCPKLFKSAQAAFPMHLGGVQYKLYYGDPSVTTGKLSGPLPFLGPKKMIYGNALASASSSTVDFEDWENQAFARELAFLWPNGERLDSTAAGYIDDYHFLAPTASLDLQVMYLALTNGVETPFAAAAVLLNP